MNKRKTAVRKIFLSTKKTEMKKKKKKNKSFNY